MFFFDPILGARARKFAGVLLVIANAALVVLQVAADQLAALPSWPWVSSASGTLAVVAFWLAKFTTFGNRVLPAEEPAS